MALAFSELGTEKANLSQDAFEKLEQFVVFTYEKNSVVTTVNAAGQKLFSQRCKAINTYISPQSTKVAISIRLGMDQGQPWKPLWTTLRQAEDSYYEPIHCGFKKTVKQDASVQLPTSHVLPYATLEETATQTSLMTAFESSSRFCVSCCNFISVQVMNLLSPVGTLD